VLTPRTLGRLWRLSRWRPPADFRRRHLVGDDGEITILIVAGVYLETWTCRPGDPTGRTARAILDGIAGRMRAALARDAEVAANRVVERKRAEAERARIAIQAEIRSEERADGATGCGSVAFEEELRRLRSRSKRRPG
jgi:hypothetical protein